MVRTCYSMLTPSNLISCLSSLPVAFGDFVIPHLLWVSHVPFHVLMLDDCSCNLQFNVFSPVFRVSRFQMLRNTYCWRGVIFGGFHFGGE